MIYFLLATQYGDENWIFRGAFKVVFWAITGTLAAPVTTQYGARIGSRIGFLRCSCL